MEKDNMIIPAVPIFVVTSTLTMGTTGDSISAGETVCTGGNSEQIRFLYFEKHPVIGNTDRERHDPRFHRRSAVYEELTRQPA